MKWPLPPQTKIVEALGCLGDDRVEIDGNTGKVYSSSRNKFYEVAYDPETNSVMSNDNLSFYVGYLGYPPIAFLMAKGVIKYNKEFQKALSGFAWKDVNQGNKNNFEKTNEEALKIAESRGYSKKEIEKDVENIYEQIVKLDLNQLGKKVRPPKGY